jgi:hypothetical protein
VFVVPNAFSSPAAGQQILKGAHAVAESYLRTILSPFFIAVPDDETVPDFIARIKQFLQIDDALFKKLRFMLGAQYSQYSHAGILKGEKTVREAIAAVVTSGDVFVFVLHPSDKKSAATRDPSLKIYN